MLKPWKSSDRKLPWGKNVDVRLCLETSHSRVKCAELSDSFGRLVSFFQLNYVGRSDWEPGEAREQVRYLYNYVATTAKRGLVQSNCLL